MTENASASEWLTARGERWAAHMLGMEAMFAPLDAPLLRALSLDGPLRIADVGCGGGGLTLEIQRRAAAGSVVHGFDISPAVIAKARARITRADHTLSFDTADMASAAAPEQPYTRLVSRFGVMFFDDPSAAFANLLRWLAPGGRFAFAVWGATAENMWLTSVRDAVATVVNLPPADADGPGPFRYAEVDKLLELLTRAGFRELEVHAFHGPLPVGGGLRAEAAATFALAAFSSFGELLAQAGDAAFHSALSAVTARFTQYEMDGAVRLDARVHIVSGTRPQSST